MPRRRRGSRDDTDDTRAIALRIAIGERIRSAREARGYSQSGLARALGLSPSSVSQWEGGSSRHVSPRQVHLQDLARVLRVRGSWIVDGIPPSGLEEVAEGAPESGRLARMVTAAEIVAGEWPSHGQMIATRYPASEAAVAVPVWSRAMTEMRPGDILVLDPTLRPAPGDIVASVAFGELHIGHLSVERQGRRAVGRLRPSTSGWPEIEIPEKSWVGVATEVSRRLR